MIRAPRKRKTIKHFHEPGQLHELTFSCYRKMPLLADDERCVLLAEAIDKMQLAQGVRLLAFVFMSAPVLNSIEYIHNNPVRKGLCVSAGDWLWSSWKHYHEPDTAPDSRLPKIERFTG